MKKLILSLCCLIFSSLNAQNPLWKIGAKIYFEEKSDKDYLGTKEIQEITKTYLKEILSISSDDCPPNAKIRLIKDGEKIKMTYFEERSRPGVGEQLHTTLLYTTARGFCNSETLEQVSSNLSMTSDPSSPPTLEQVAKKYDTIIEPEWKFKISEITLTQSSGTAFIIAKLLHKNRETISIHGNPISAGLHMTLVNIADTSVFKHDELSRLIAQLNTTLQGQQIKIGNRQGHADLEFGISGTPERLRPTKN